MIYFIGTILEEETKWEVMPYYDNYLDDGITISFPLPIQLDEREALNYLKQHLKHEEKEWLQFDKGNIWSINLGVFKSKYSKEIEYGLNPYKGKVYEPDITYLEMDIDTKLSLDIFNCIVKIIPEVRQKNENKVSQTTIRFTITYEQIMDARPRKIFLSHKSADKELVRDFKETLLALGYDPWIDEDHLNAGDRLHRGILNAFKESSAAIFFITQSFEDEKYLATEIDYAITEATDRGSAFRIITLAFGTQADGVKIPELLTQYVYKTPKTHLQALREIMKALKS